MRISALITRAAAIAPDRPALIDEASITSFSELAHNIAHIAASLRQKAPGVERIGVCSQNSIAMATALYSVPEAGAIAVFANVAQHPDEIARNFVRARVGHLIGAEPVISEIGAALRRQSVDIEATSFDALYDTVPPTNQAQTQTGDVAWLLHTSGTTGIPKGVLLTHANLLAAADNARLARAYGEDDVLLLPFPLFHIASTNMLVAHSAARPVVLPPAFDPRAVLDLIDKHRVTAVSLAPTMLVRLLDHPHRRDVDLSSLRTVFYGAAPIAPALLERASSELGCAFSQGYGMTEVGGNAVFLDPAAHRRGLTEDPSLLKAAGRPGPRIALSTIRDNEMPCDAGEVGEIALRGAQVFSRYDDDEEATKAAFTSDGWFRTGDLGTIDASGTLTVVDRKKDIVITGGENVSSLEVERILSSQPFVRAASVVGVVDDEWGEAVTAVLVVDAAFDESAVRASLRHSLAGYKRPKHYLYLDTLPLGGTGKVDKAALRRFANAKLRP